LRDFISEKHYILKVINDDEMKFTENESHFYQNHHTLTKIEEVILKINHLFSKMGKK